MSYVIRHHHDVDVWFTVGRYETKEEAMKVCDEIITNRDETDDDYHCVFDSSDLRNGHKQNWYFTFGTGQGHDNCFVKIFGTYDSARQFMVDRFGDKWGFQYSSADEAGTKRWKLQEIR